MQVPHKKVIMLTRLLWGVFLTRSYSAFSFILHSRACQIEAMWLLRHHTFEALIRSLNVHVQLR